MQFTLSRLLAATGLIAFGIAGATLPWRISGPEAETYHPIILALMLIHFWSSGAVIGAGIGLLFNRPWRGAMWGFLASFALVLLA